jgi:ABC-type amino acid transport substrate-binding protein
MRRRSVAPVSPPAAGPVRGSVRSAPVLRVGAALPDPPFEFVTGAGPSGFDIILMQRIAERIGRTWQLVPYEGPDFNGIFAGLESGAYDCIASGTTITPERERLADFCAAYAISGQSLVIDPGRHPSVHGIADLTGLVIGVQHGNTSQPVAARLVPVIGRHATGLKAGACMPSSDGSGCGPRTWRTEPCAVLTPTS